jgi:small membrane protein
VIAQTVISILLIGVVVYAASEGRRSPFVASLSIVSATAGLYFTWTPDHATQVAMWAGVGRGVDLVLYIWVCISLIVLLNLHLKLRRQMELVTDMARTIALDEARHGFSQTAAPPQARPQPSVAGEHSSIRSAAHASDICAGDDVYGRPV